MFIFSLLGVTLDTYSCMDPGIPVNGARLSHDLSIGSTVSFQCNPGYRLSHEEPLVCEKNHFWSHPLPTCDGMFTYNISNGGLSFNSVIVPLNSWAGYDVPVIQKHSGLVGIGESRNCGMLSLQPTAGKPHKQTCFTSTNWSSLRKHPTLCY